MKIRTAALAILAALSLPAAAHAYGPAADGYKFEGKEFVQHTMTVTWVVVPQRRDLETIAAEKGAELPRGADAFSAYRRPPAAACTIYTVDPEAEYHPELYGHELSHCFFGNFHKRALRGEATRVAAR